MEVMPQDTGPGTALIHQGGNLKSPAERTTWQPTNSFSLFSSPKSWNLKGRKKIVDIEITLVQSVLPSRTDLRAIQPKSLAGVSRSVTLVVAYVMTITDLGWEDALAAVRGARTCANPNMGFQKQLEDFGKCDVVHLRNWLKETYGESPFLDEEEAKQLVAKHKQHEEESGSAGSSGRQWSSNLSSLSSMAYSNYTTET